MRFFISYSRSVKSELRPVIELLRSAGHEVWWDADIPEMADWWSTILDHIEWCQVCVFVVSEKSVQSPYCLTELAYATDRNRPILPFVIDDHNPYTIPPEVTPMRNQWFVYDGDLARTLSRIQAACSQIDWNRHKDIQKARPIEPNTGAGSLVKEFQQAVTLAENGHFDEAIKRFRNVSSLDFREWGDECQQWVARLQLYRDIAELAEHKATYVRAQKKWADYLTEYDAEFDPLDVHGKLPKTEPIVAMVAPPEPAPGARWTDPKGVSMVYVPAGQFLMGSTEQQVDQAFAMSEFEDEGFLSKATLKDELPQHKITITQAFWLDLTPVTNEAYAHFIKDGGYGTREFWTVSGWKWVQENKKQHPKNYKRNTDFTRPRKPRVGVTWYEAYAYCAWRGGRLPTEAEWEWAARGPDNQVYPWGNDFTSDDIIGTGHGTTMDVGDMIRVDKESWVGALDMSGNVWEWCSSLCWPYPYNPTDGREDFDKYSDSERVSRGGAWGIPVTAAFRAVCRNRFPPSTEANGIGFRCVRSFEQ